MITLTIEKTTLLFIFQSVLMRDQPVFNSSLLINSKGLLKSLWSELPDETKRIALESPSFRSKLDYWKFDYKEDEERLNISLMAEASNQEDVRVFAVTVDGIPIYLGDGEKEAVFVYKRNEGSVLSESYSNGVWSKVYLNDGNTTEDEALSYLTKKMVDKGFITNDAIKSKIEEIVELIPPSRRSEYSDNVTIAAFQFYKEKFEIK